MTYDANDPHERLAMRVAEHSQDFVLVVRINDVTRVIVSDPDWAKAVQDRIEPAIEEAAKQARSAPSEDRRHGAHGKSEQGDAG